MKHRKIVVLLLLFFIGIICVNPITISATNSSNNTTGGGFDKGTEVTGSCNGIFTADALDLINEILGYVRILGPILLIVMTSIDFASAVLAQDNDAMKKAGSKVIKRAIATVGLLLIPTLVRVLIDLPGVRNTIQISDDPLCGIG